MTESLCESCEHGKEVVSRRGSRFLLCRLCFAADQFPKYPPQPIVRCEGFRERPDSENA